MADGDAGILGGPVRDGGERSLEERPEVGRLVGERPGEDAMCGRRRRGYLRGGRISLQPLEVGLVRAGDRVQASYIAPWTIAMYRFVTAGGTPAVPVAPRVLTFQSRMT